jgi:hypothetical protein
MRASALLLALGAQCGLCLVLTHAPSPVGTSFAPMMAAAGGFSPTAPALVRRSAAVMSLASTDDIATAPPSVGRIDVGVEGVREMTTDQKAYLAELLEKCSNPNMQEVWRRAAFWENETATLLEIVNVLGRYESCSEWTQRSLFIDLAALNITSKAEDQRQALTQERHAMALRLKCGERAALWQNVPNFPFTNAALAKSVGLTVEDFEHLPVTRAACEVLYDGLAESRSTLIPYAVLDARRDAMLTDGGFNLNAYRLGWSKSCILFIVGFFLLGKANFLWVLVGVKFLHDWQPELIPGPKEMGLFKIWGIV